MVDIHFKDSVSPVQGLQLPIIRAMVICSGVLHGFGKRFTITSLNDGKHSDRSLHFRGLGMDIRSRDEGPSYAQWPGDLKRQIANAMRNALGQDYDVVIESDHFHVEYDPK